jgi:hypothetical protein
MIIFLLLYSIITLITKIESSDGLTTATTTKEKQDETGVKNPKTESIFSNPLNKWARETGDKMDKYVYDWFIKKRDQIKNMINNKKNNKNSTRSEI